MGGRVKIFESVRYMVDVHYWSVPTKWGSNVVGSCTLMIQLTINSHSYCAKPVWVIHLIIGTRCLGINNGYCTSIICTGVAQLYVINGEGKILVKHVTWELWQRGWGSKGDWTIPPPNTVVLSQSSRHYSTMDSGCLALRKDIRWWNRDIGWRKSCNEGRANKISFCLQIKDLFTGLCIITYLQAPV